MAPIYSEVKLGPVDKGLCDPNCPGDVYVVLASVAVRLGMIGLKMIVDYEAAEVQRMCWGERGVRAGIASFGEIGLDELELRAERCSTGVHLMLVVLGSAERKLRRVKKQIVREIWPLTHNGRKVRY